MKKLTVDSHWDCECETHYIHLKSETKCHKCGANSDEQPDSRADELAKAVACGEVAA